MRRALALMMCLLLATTALGAYTEFYVTKHGSALDTNGGSGEAGPINVADVTAVHDGAGVHTLTDNGVDGFAGTNVGDFICWDTGAAKEFARVNSVTSDDVIVVLNMVGAVAFTNLANCAVSVGGAWATVDHAASTIATTFVNAAADPPRVNIKYDAAAYSEQVQIDNTGSLAVLISYEGYFATAGDDCDDGGTLRLPTISSAATAIPGVIVAASGKDYLRFKHLRIEASGAGIEAINATSDQSYFMHLRMKTTGNSASGLMNYGYDGLYLNVYVEEATYRGMLIGPGGTAIGCYVKDCLNVGYDLRGDCHAIACIADTCAVDGFFVEAGCATLYQCVAYGTTAGSGVQAQSKPGVSVIGCILASNNQYGIEAGTVNPLHEDFNAFYNNGVNELLNISPQSGAGAHVGPNSITLSGDPFTSAAGHDFSLDATAGEGAACRDAGFPGSMLDGTNVGHGDIGALQHDDPAGGGGGAQIIDGTIIK